MESQANRIMNIAKDNTLAAILLAGINPDDRPRALDNLEKFQFGREMVNCVWNHIVARDRAAFDKYIISLTIRPAGCPRGCIWSPPVKDEAQIFGEQKKPSFHDCTMEDCDAVSQYFCGRCYCVRYCGPTHQRLDWDRHSIECKAMVESVNLLAPYGRDYARREIKNQVSISDECFDRLWKKHAPQ